MVTAKTARQKLRNHTRYFDFTIEIYRDACEIIGRVVYERWSDVAAVRGSKARAGYIENLIHSTAKNAASYPEFDKQFHKFPSYLRRASIGEALGHVTSHMTALGKWKDNPNGKAPSFQPRRSGFPVLYKGNMSEWIENGKVRLKLFNSSDWIWVTVPFDPIKTLKRFPSSEGWTRQNPMLVQRDKRWMLHFPFERNVSLQEKDSIRPVISVDLGLTTTAVCSVLRSDGTVLHREFISYGREKDRLSNTLGFIAVKSAQTWYIPEGEPFCKSQWTIVRRLTEEIAHRCSKEIVDIAVKFGCQTVVFEHLGKLKVPRHCFGAARRRKKFHYWLQGRIQKYTRYKAQANGIRFSRVLARGTSQYAFDGSGKVLRVGNRQTAIFAHGQKVYNCDLSASYNIGARYWIRELLDTQKPARNEQVATQDESSLAVVARHQQTLASLISLVRSVSPGDDTAPVPYSGQSCSPLRETATTAAA